MSAKIHFRDYNPKQMILFPQRLDKDIAGNDPVRVVDAVIDSLNLENFRKLYKERGRSPYHPNMMLKVVIYGYMNNLYSCRKIESALKRDIHFIWLAGYEQPDFNTINRFRNLVKDEINRIFTQLVIILAEKGFLTLVAEYIDGTKIESKANKYTFVWRKTTAEEGIKHRGRRCIEPEAVFAIAFNLKKMCSTMTKLGINGGFCPKQKQITDIAIIFYVKKLRFEGNSQYLAA